MSESNKRSTIEKESVSRKHSTKSKGLVFLIGVAGMSTLAGFGFAIALSKKKDPNMFNKGIIGQKGIPESGGSLALKALGWGSLYSVGGFSLFCFTIWKLMGVNNMEEFRQKVQNTLPQIPKTEPQGKNDFKTVRELVEYITQDGGNSDNKKA